MTASRRTLLVVTDRRFWRRSIGSEQRIANLLEHLAHRPGTRVVVACLDRPASAERRALDAFASALPALEIRVRSSTPSARLADALVDTFAHAFVGSPIGPLRRRGSPGDPSPFRAASAARRRFVQALLLELAPQVVLVEFLRLTSTVHPRPARGGARAPAYLVDTHDVLHERAARFRAEGASSAFDVDAAQEARALRTYDAILAIQARDAATLRGLVPDRPVLTVPHGLALPSPAPSFLPGPRPLRLGFLAGRDASNRAGLGWFLDTVWPTLVGRFGASIELRVAGALGGEPRRSGAEGDAMEGAEKGAAARGVVFVGPVPTIDDFWPTVDVAINPIRFGSGLKIKNVETLAYRRALITTPIGAEGLEAAAPEGLAIAETPAQWVGVLTTWIEDREALARTAEAGRLHAERHFSPTAAFRALDEHLDRLEEGAASAPGIRS